MNLKIYPQKAKLRTWRRPPHDFPWCKPLLLPRRSRRGVFLHFFNTHHQPSKRANMKQHGYPEVYESGYHMLELLCYGHKSETVASWLMEKGNWVNPKLDTNAARVRKCLSPTGDQYFSPSDVDVLMAKTGRFDPIFYRCDLMGAPRPEIPEHLKKLAELEEQKNALEAKLHLINSQLTVLSDRHDSPNRFLRYSRGKGE